MAISSLSGSYIDQTYQRLVQTDETRTEFADGLGRSITFGTTNTGSLLTTASAAGNTITFKKGDNTTFDVTLISSSATASFVTASNVYGPFGSNSIISASYAQLADTASFSQTASDIIIQVLNQSGNQIDKGLVVHVSGSSNASDIPRVRLADYNNDNLSANTLGIAMSNIPNGELGYTMIEGVFKGYDTETPGWISGQLIFLGANGTITGSAPQAPLHSVRLGQVIRVQQNNGSLYVRIDNGYELNELHDVVVSSPNTGDFLIRSGSVWINSKTLSGSYVLSGSITATSINATSITGSLFGTASFSVSSSRAISSSYALTASYIINAGGASTDTGSLLTTASVSLNTILFTKGDGSTFPITVDTGSQGGAAAFPYTGSANISGSLTVTGSLNVSGGIFGNLIVPTGNGTTDAPFINFEIPNSYGIYKVSPQADPVTVDMGAIIFPPVIEGATLTVINTSNLYATIVASPYPVNPKGNDITELAPQSIYNFYGIDGLWYGSYLTSP